MDDQERRDAAVKRIKEKCDFRNHLVSYLVINVFLVGIWALSGAGLGERCRCARCVSSVTALR